MSVFCGLLQRTKNIRLLSRSRGHLTTLGRKEKKSMTNDKLKKIEFLNTVYRVIGQNVLMKTALQLDK